MADTQIQFIITAKDEASQALKGIQNNLKDLQPAFQTMAVNGGLAFAGVSLAIKGFIDASTESDQAVAQLGAVLESTGGKAGITKDAAIGLSKELQRLTPISDETALSAENMLLTFTNIGKEQFPTATKAVVDMATAMNGGVTPSMEQVRNQAILLGKALQDPDAGLGALHRVGVNVDELKKQFTDTMPIMEKQKLILQELGSEFGGSAAKQLDTFAGKQAQLKNKLNDVQELIGGALQDALLKLVTAITPLVDKFASWAAEHPKLIADMLLVIAGITGLIAVVGALGLAMGAIITTVEAVATVMAVLFSPVGAIIAVIAALGFVIYEAVQHWHEIVAVMKEVVDFVAAVFIVGWKIQIDILKALWNGMVEALKFILDFLQGAFIEFMDAFFPGWQARWEQFKMWFVTLWNDLTASTQKALTTVRDFFTNTWTQIKTWWDGFIAPFRAGWDAAWQGVAHSFLGVWETIKGAFKTAVNFIIGEINGLIAAINRLIEGINKVATVGGHLGGGIPTIPAIPMLAEGGIVTKPTLAMIGEAGAEAVIPLNQGAGAGFGGANITINFGTFIGGGMTMQELGLELGDAIIDKLKLNVRV